MSSALEIVSDLWNRFSSSSDPAILRESFSDQLHGPFAVHLIGEVPLHTMSPVFIAEKQKSTVAAARDQCAAGPIQLDVEWAHSVHSALTQVLLGSSDDDSSDVDTRDMLFQLQFFAHRSTSGQASSDNFLTCGSYFELEADEAVEVWFRSLVLCEFVHSLLRYRERKRQRVVPWVSTALSLLRVDDTTHKMPAAYVRATTELLSTMARICRDEVAALVKSVAKPSAPLINAAPSLLSLAFKIRWHQSRCCENGDNASSATNLGLYDLIDSIFLLREQVVALQQQPSVSVNPAAASSPEQKQMRLLLLAAELGLVRIAAAFREPASSSSSSSSSSASSYSCRGAAPAALQGRFLQHGNLAGALSSGLEQQHPAAANSGHSQSEIAETDAGGHFSADPAAASRGRAMIMDAVQRKEARLKNMRHADIKFLTSSDDDDDDRSESNTSSSNNNNIHSSSVAWRKRQAILLHSSDSTSNSEETARIKAFLQQSSLSSLSAASAEVASSSLEHCCLAEPFVAAGWFVHALDVFTPLQQRDTSDNGNGSSSRSSSQKKMMLVLTVFSHAAQFLRVTFDPATITNGIIHHLALGIFSAGSSAVPLYSISCEKLSEGIRRLSFLLGADEQDDDSGSEISRLLASSGAVDAEKRTNVINSFLDTLKEAVVARRSAVGESVALALQSLAWLVSQPPSSSEEQRQQSQPTTYIQAMNSLLQRCDENTRFKLTTSLLVLSPHDSFSTTFLAAFRFCIQDDLRLCETTAAAASSSSSSLAISRHDLRSPFLDGALILMSLAAAVAEWSRVLKNHWFGMRSESCMTVLQILASLRSVDARLKKLSSVSAAGSSGGVFDWSTEKSSIANRRALLCAKECIIDKIEKNVEAANAKKSQQQQQQQQAEQTATTTATLSGLGECSELMLHQFASFLNAAKMSLLSLSRSG